MPHSEAQAWWADVQHVRETIERRRAGLADSPAPADAGETRFGRLPGSSGIADDLDWTQVSSTSGGRRADRAPRSEWSAGRTRRRGEEAGDTAEHATARGRRADDHLAASIASDPERRSRRERDRAEHGTRPGADATPSALSAPRRRTVEITGRTVAAPPLPRLVEVERRRPPRRAVERVGPRPDRVALWAVLLGFFLILVAATSSHAATPAAPAHAGATVALHASAR